MTKIYSILALLVLASTSFGQARRLVKASSSGNWDVAGTWTTTGLPATPLNNDSIVIPAGITVTVAGTNGVNFALSNSIIDIFGTLVFNTPNGTTKKNDISISTTTTAPVYVVRIASTGSIIAGSGGNGSGNLNVLVNGGTSQIKYSTAGVAGVPVGQSAGPTIVGPAFAQNTALPTNPAYFTTGSAAALPVSISLFKAALAGNSVTLNWTSLQEINSSAYIVEKSDNGTSNWYELGTVAAAGNAGVATKYQFADNKAAAINYYRLRIVDNDGRYIYSNVIVVRAQDINTNISLFPNPAVNNVNITIGRGLVQHGFTLNIINHNGQMVARKQVVDGTSTLSLDVSHLKSGNYTLDILFANGVREAHKLVIAK